MTSIIEREDVTSPSVKIQIDPDPVTKVLIRARERIKKGWVKGQYAYRSDDVVTPRYCLVGAVALDDYREDWIATSARNETLLDSAWSKLGFINDTEAIDWNDDPSITVDDVIRRLDDAIARSI